MTKVIYKGFTRYQMINMIYLETDTCSWCLEASDKELIEGFVEIFGVLQDN
jgi:hypothetical protein